MREGRNALVTSLDRQTKTAAPPKLYDLTTLQRDANRLLNNKKVSDHHAIIPTMEIRKGDLSRCSAEEMNILILLLLKSGVQVCPLEGEPVSGTDAEKA